LWVKGDMEGAMNAYQQAISLNPSFIEARLAVGQLYLEQGDHLRAIVVFRQIIEDLPQNADAYYGLGIALKNRSRFQEAITNLQMAQNLYRQQGYEELAQLVQQELNQLSR